MGNWGPGGVGGADGAGRRAHIKRMETHSTKTQSINPGPTFMNSSHMSRRPRPPHTPPDRPQPDRYQDLNDLLTGHSSAAVGTSAFARGLRSEGRVGPRAAAASELSSIRWPRGGAFAFSLFSVFLRPALGTWLGLGSRLWMGPT